MELVILDLMFWYRKGHNVEYLVRLADFMREKIPEEYDEHLSTLETLVRNRIKENNMCLKSLMGEGPPSLTSHENGAEGGAKEDTPVPKCLGSLLPGVLDASSRGRSCDGSTVIMRIFYQVFKIEVSAHIEQKRMGNYDLLFPCPNKIFSYAQLGSPNGSQLCPKR
ncbi:hypothetical protein Avbf_05360 [Armadillidium vulgare]|nr:hypothetical protein Avbf_05360 [Armadillidium vulgare]